MTNFGSYMLNQNPNHPSNGNNVMIVAMSRSPEGYWVMTSTWDGGDNTKPVFMGSDEMMTLTDAERSARDAMTAALTLPDDERSRLTRLAETSRQEGASAAASEAESKFRSHRRGWFLFAMTGWATAAALYALAPSI